MLELARLESPAGPAELAAFDAVLVLRDVVRLLAPSVSTESLRLTARASHAEIVIESNEASLYTILHNLIGNAIKFTTRGTIDVSVVATASSLQIMVEDTGVGISTDFLPQLFDEFTQESTGLTRAFEGSGLGLAITQRAVESLGGEIGVETTKGSGSRFRVTLPTSPRAAGDPVAMEVS